jgi:hypothetical protein
LLLSLAEENGHGLLPLAGVLEPGRAEQGAQNTDEHQDPREGEEG